MAAIWMRLSSLGDSSEEYDAEVKRSFWRRCCDRLPSMPYNMSCFLLLWVCLNGAMTAPWTPLPVTALILMSSLYSFSSKTATELSLAYTMGDPSVFVSVQNWSRNLESFGAIVSCLLGPLLYETELPVAPFIFTASLSAVVLLVFTAGFCSVRHEDDTYDFEEDEIEGS